MPIKKNSRVRIIEHTADIGLEITAPDRAGIFRESAWGMFNLIVDLARVKVEERLAISLEANGYPELLVRWLNELLYYSSARHYLFADFQIDHLDSTRLQAVAGGELIKSGHLPLQHEIKAATYNELFWEEDNSGVKARVIFDL